MLKEVIQTGHQANGHPFVSACAQGFLDFGDILGCDDLEILVPIHHKHRDFHLAKGCARIVVKEVTEPRCCKLLHLGIHHRTVLLRFDAVC